MAYSAGNNLPFEPTSKIGHLAVINSEWVNELIRNFESTEEESVSGKVATSYMLIMELLMLFTNMQFFLMNLYSV